MLACPSLSTRVCSNSFPLSEWCHPIISSSVTLSFSSLQSFPASGSFPMSQFFASGARSIGVSALASVLPMNIQGWFSLGLIVLISLLSKGLSRDFSSTTIWKHQIFGTQLYLWSNSSRYMSTGKMIYLTVQTFVNKVMSLLSNMLSWFVIAFLLRNKCLLISWVQPPSTVNLEPPKIKAVTDSTFPLLFAMKWWDLLPCS